jgi:GrpB-like predicted nucleotidyltransferase (UPF0157 family)
MSIKDQIELVQYDVNWPAAYDAEVVALRKVVVPFFDGIEHFGSTAVPGLRAKPVIDMMAGVAEIADRSLLEARLAPLGYSYVDTGMSARWLFRRDGNPACHLHVVASDTLPTRKEILFRDYLLTHPTACAEYAALKDKLAQTFREDRLAYTKGKTDFVQRILDEVHDARGWKRSDVWET